MILAAGRGERLRPLTDALPKPLVEVAGKPLVVHQLERLAAAGIRRVVINVSWLAERLEAALGDGARWGIELSYSREGDPPLETGGGILAALDELGEGPFLVLNGDVWTDLDPSGLAMPAASDAHLVLVPNPSHNPAGDFRLEAGRVRPPAAAGNLTFAGIGLYRATLFAGCEPGRFPLGPLLVRAAAAGRVSGQRHDGGWWDVGSRERLEALRRHLAPAAPG